MRSFFLLFSAVILFASCSKKEQIIVPESNVKSTDKPPKELFAPGAAYGQTYRVWVDSALVLDAIIMPWQCSWSSGTPADCGYWYIVPVKKYWGIMNGYTYVSNSIDWIQISPNNEYIQMLDAVKRKGTAIGYLCNNCNGPWGPNLVNGFN